MKDTTSVKFIEEMHHMIWEELVPLEPELERLLGMARMVGDGCRRWRDVERGFSPFKRDITRLVGFFGHNRAHPVLGTRAAYEVTYWKLHNAIARDPREK